jgi:anti-sigma regulatory factor (Ser/Thr protein kinase)
MNQAGATPRLTYAVMLVVEELVTNTIKYGYDDREEHRIRLTLELSTPVSLCIEDDGHAFDPLTQAPAVALDAAVEERPIGGLGLHMVRAETASMRYRRIQDTNRLEVEFRQ